MSEEMEAEVAAAPMTDEDFVAKAQRFVDLTARKKALAADLKEIDDELGALQEPLSEQFIERGVSKISLGDATLYVQRDIGVALVVPDAMTPDEARRLAIKALVDLGHESMITYNHQSVRSLVKSMIDQDGELLPPLGDVLRVEELYNVRARGVAAASD